MAEPDLFDAFQSGREALRRMQESFARFAMPAEQRQALADGMAQLMFPADGVRAMSDFIDAFGPPLAQIEALRSELAEQREQLSRLDDRLAHMEAAAERLALAGEQLTAFQEPFVRMASLFTGQDISSFRSTGAEDTGDDGDIGQEADDDEDTDGTGEGSADAGGTAPTKKPNNRKGPKR